MLTPTYTVPHSSSDSGSQTRASFQIPKQFFLGREECFARECDTWGYTQSRYNFFTAYFKHLENKYSGINRELFWIPPYFQIPHGAHVDFYITDSVRKETPTIRMDINKKVFGFVKKLLVCDRECIIGLNVCFTHTLRDTRVVCHSVPFFVTKAKKNEATVFSLDIRNMGTPEDHVHDRQVHVDMYNRFIDRLKKNDVRIQEIRFSHRLQPSPINFGCKELGSPYIMKGYCYLNTCFLMEHMYAAVNLCFPLHREDVYVCEVFGDMLKERIEMFIRYPNTFKNLVMNYGASVLSLFCDQKDNLHEAQKEGTMLLLYGKGFKQLGKTGHKNLLCEYCLLKNCMPTIIGIQCDHDVTGGFHNNKERFSEALCTNHPDNGFRYFVPRVSSFEELTTERFDMVNIHDLNDKVTVDYVKDKLRYGENTFRLKDQCFVFLKPVENTRKMPDYRRVFGDVYGTSNEAETVTGSLEEMFDVRDINEGGYRRPRSNTQTVKSPDTNLSEAVKIKRNVRRHQICVPVK